MSPYNGIFKSKYSPLSGKDWLRKIDPDDLAVFVHIGQAATEFGRLGGTARAATAKRDYRGRFAPAAGPAPVPPTPEQVEQENRKKYGLVEGLDF